MQQINSPVEEAMLEYIRILMKTIMKTNMFLLKIKSKDQKLNDELVEILELYQNIYNELLDGPMKERLTEQLRGGKVDG